MTLLQRAKRRALQQFRVQFQVDKKRAYVHWLLSRSVDRIVGWIPPARERRGTLVVLCPFSHGDVLLTIPGLVKLEALSDEPVTVTCAVKPPLSELLENRFDCVFPSQRHAGINPFSRLRLAFRLRRRGFRRAIRLQVSPSVTDCDTLLAVTGARTMSLAWPGPPDQYSRVRALGRPLLDDVLAPLEEQDPEAPHSHRDFPPIVFRHTVERMYQALSAFNGTPLVREPLEYVPEVANPIAGAPPYVVINVGGKKQKKWPLDNLYRVARAMISEGFAIAIAGGPQEAERLERLAGRLEADRLNPLRLDSATCPTIDHLFASIRDARCMISPDSFLYHAAVLLSVPCVCIYALCRPVFGWIGPFVPYPQSLTRERVEYVVFETIEQYHMTSNEHADRVAATAMRVMNPGIGSAQRSVG